MSLTPIKRKHYTVPDGIYYGKWTGNRVYVFVADQITHAIDVKEMTERKQSKKVRIDVEGCKVKISIIN